MRDDDQNASGPPASPGEVAQPMDRLLAEAFRDPRRRAATVDAPDRDILGGRFLLGEEIGRGGMGRVLRARDLAFDRDVAVKLLSSDSTDDRDRVRRFRREARIAAGLQHPGVPPVHESGQDREGRPFFAMKLIEGRTLASALAERRAPTDDRFRLLSIFAQVCQTVAYAHAHGVVHRDLKPANVMLGAFGEVMVLDWGIAGVVFGQGGAMEGGSARGSVVVSTVAGTPDYMAPEQADAGVAIDRRADVFSLGAILFEILTGRVPPRTTYGDEEPHVDAGEDDLRALCSRCLQRHRNERPRDAEEVAAAVNAHLVGVERRRREAEIAVAAEQAKTEEVKQRLSAERRARRFMSAFVLVVVVVALSTWGVFEWLQDRETRRVGSLLVTLDQVQGEALALRAEARAAPEPDIALWDEVERRVTRARVMCGDPGIDPIRRDALAALVTEIGVEADAARAARTVLDRDATMAAELDRIRVGVTSTWNWVRVRDASAAAFVAHGIDVLDDATETTAKRLRQSAIAADLENGLDNWALALKAVEGQDSPGYRKVMAVAMAVPEDALRQRVKRAVYEARIDELRELVSNSAGERLEIDDLLAIGDSLGWAGRVGDAIDAYRRGVDRRPGDYWAHAQLGFWYQKDTPPEHEAAARHFTAAVALAPHSAVAWSNLGATLHGLSRQDDAEASLTRAIDLDPAFAPARQNLALVFEAKGRPDEALEILRGGLSIDPKAVALWLQLARTLNRDGRSGEAAAAARSGLALAPQSLELAMAAAEALIAESDPRAARDLLKSSLPHGGFERVDTLRLYARACRLAGDPLEAVTALWHVTRIAKPDGRTLQELFELTRALPEPGRRLALWMDVASRTGEGDPGVALALAEACLADDRVNEALTRLLALPADPSGSYSPLIATWLEQARRMTHFSVDLEATARLDPQDVAPADRPLAARVLAKAGRPRDAVRLFAVALEAAADAADLDLLGRGWPCALAAADEAGRDAGADAATFARQWREFALDGARRELAKLSAGLAASDPFAVARIRTTIEPRLDKPEFGSVRGPALDDLDDAEGDDWRAYWAAAESLLRSSAP